MAGGGFAYLPGVARPFSAGVIAAPGRALIRVRPRAPMSLDRGFAFMLAQASIIVPSTEKCSFDSSGLTAGVRQHRQQQAARDIARQQPLAALGEHRLAYPPVQKTGAAARVTPANGLSNNKKGRNAMKNMAEMIAVISLVCCVTPAAYAGGSASLNEQLVVQAEGPTQGGSVQSVEKLLSEGADVNAKALSGATALQMAAMGGNTDIAKLLLAKGADVNGKGVYQQTALMGAAQNEHPDIVKLLLAKGADVNATDKNGWTALMQAAGAVSGHVDIGIMKMLLAKGADVNAKDKNGDTALMSAAAGLPEGGVALLLTKGADVNVIDRFGMTALRAAVQQNRADSVKLLEAAGAH